MRNKMTLLKKAFPLLLMIWFWSGNVSAQNYRFNHLGMENGLSQGSVFSILQDSKGFLWVGTEDGLNKYDGYSFEIFRNNPLNKQSIVDNTITSLEESGSDIWVGTRSGLCKYDKNKNTFKWYLHDKNDNNSISDDHITSIVTDDKGRIWVSSYGINMYDSKKDCLVTYLVKPDLGTKLPCNQIYSSTKDSKGNIWLSTIEGLYCFNTNSLKFVSYTFEYKLNSLLGPTHYYYCYEDHNHNYWIATRDKGLFYYNHIDGSMAHFINNPSDPHSLCGHLINQIVMDREGNIFIPTNEGLSIIDNKTAITPNNPNIFKNLKSVPNDKNTLSTNDLNCCYEDRDGRIWVGGRFGDLNVYDKNCNQFLLYDFTKMGNDFLSSNMMGMTEDKEGNIYYAADGGGIYVWQKSTGKFKVIRSNIGDKKSLTNNKILTLYVDEYNCLWIGTWGGGVDKLDLKTNAITHFHHSSSDSSSLSIDNVFFITEDKENNILIGCWKGGINVYDRKNNNFIRTPYKFSPSVDISKLTVNFILEDKEQNIWLGSEDEGLYRINKKDKYIKKYRSNKKDPLSLSHMNILAILEDSKGRLWIGTSCGLNLFNRKDETFKKFYVKDGLPNDFINGLLEDQTGHIWMTTNKGIAKLDISGTDDSNLQISARKYDKDDGLQSNQFTRSSCYKTRNGDLLIGGMNGINKFNPETLSKNTKIPPVVLTSLSISNKLVQPGTDGSPLQNSISETNELELSHNQSNLSIEYAALNFTNPQNNEYSYKLIGFDDNWNNVGKIRKATYTNLAPGTYTFVVKASNNDGVWNDEGASIKIIIAPPFWATWWFRTIVILLIAWYSRSWYIRTINKRKSLEEINKKLETEIKLNKEAEEEKYRFSEEARKKDEEVKQTLKDQQEYLQQGFDLLLAKMNKFSEGDLGVSIEINSDGSFERLFTGFNKAVENFKKLILNLIEAIKSTATASDQINISAESIYHGTTEQSSRSEEVVAAVEEMTQNIVINSQHSEMASKASIEAKKIAIEGGVVVHKTIDSIAEINDVIYNASDVMKKLGDSSNEISNVVELIEEIADQTNLLALNAAIEAARAGEQGRGFAVVADEVKKLSERTSAAIKNVAEMIKRIQTDSNGAINAISKGLVKVNNGKEYAKQASTSLEKIIESVSKVSNIIEQVAIANEQQSQGAQHISESMVMISDVSKDNAQRAEQVTSAISDLRNLTAGLQEGISKFDIDEKLITKPKHIRKSVN